MSLGCCLQEIAIHLGAHDDHLVNRFKGLGGSLARQRLQVDVRQPINILDEGIRGIRQLLRRGTNLVPGRHHGRSTGSGHLVLCNDILELQEPLVGLLGIRAIHQGLHVRRHLGVGDVLHRIVDSHDLCLWDGCDHTAKSCVHLIPVRSRCHAVWPTDAPDGLVVCLRGRFQKLGIRSSAHLDHLVNRLQSFQRLELPGRLQEDAVVPVHLLGKVVGRIS
mmetsp:Transcript_56809/g.135543  ORF Transcript_56809/g.135543 Transcript_56809/m.135543 type:complete len:220 (-) Transcript_56809:272-931(-)